MGILQNWFYRVFFKEGGFWGRNNDGWIFCSTATAHLPGMKTILLPRQSINLHPPGKRGQVGGAMGG
ncbi:MAG: hypothetical protein M0P70_00545 [Desulfobulbaceae bacterium]|nr:hypothetical protein [Desulfobulbaceae bacterium]